MGPKSPYRRACLVPRCRLITSWSCRRFQGLGCSPIKVVRELGLERRETVRFLSVILLKTKKMFLLYERIEKCIPLVNRLFHIRHCRVATYKFYNC